MRVHPCYRKRLTYILATKNRAKFLSDVLSRMHQLRYDTDELIIVDGGSTDETRDVVSSYRHLVDVFVSEPDESEGHAFNKGILLSKGKYVKLLTDDDTLFPAAMDQAVGVLEKNPWIDVLLCGGTRVENGKKTVIYLPPHSEYGTDVADPLRMGGCGIGMVIRTSVFAHVGLLNPEAVALDLDFLTQCISRKGIVRFCRINMFVHPVAPHSGTVLKRDAWMDDWDRIRRRYGVSDTRHILFFRRALRFFPPWFVSFLHTLGRFFFGSGMRTRHYRKEQKYIWDAGISCL